MGRPDRQHIHFSQNGSTIALSADFGAVASVAAALNTIGQVFMGTSPAKMGRIAAGWVVATVERIRATRRGWTDSQGKRHRMGSHFSPANFAIGQDKCAVTGFEPVSLPRPAIVWPLHVYLVPETRSNF